MEKLSFSVIMKKTEPVITNIEREDEYMAAAESFQNFIENLPHENEIDEELEEEPYGKQSEEQDEDIFAE